jgi:hypothetical protein
MVSSDLDSGGFRLGRCGSAWALVAFSDLGVAGSVQTHVGGVGVGLAMAACSNLVGGSVVQHGQCRQRPGWLWWCGFGQGRSQRSPDPVFQQHSSFLSFFFFFEMMCQYVIGGHKTQGFCHDLIEGALNKILSILVLVTSPSARTRVA